MQPKMKTCIENEYVWDELEKILPSLISSGWVCRWKKSWPFLCSSFSLCHLVFHLCLMAAGIGGFFFPLVYLGQWRVTEIVKRLIDLGGSAFHEEKESTVQDKGSVWGPGCGWAENKASAAETAWLHQTPALAKEIGCLKWTNPRGSPTSSFWRQHYWGRTGVGLPGPLQGEAAMTIHGQVCSHST